MKITVVAELNKTPEQIVNRIFDDDTMAYIHTMLHRFCSDYVPMDGGMLDSNVSITPDYLEYKQPYAHYQWAGDVYGPSFPIFEDGVFAGFRSPKNKSKYPTGKKLKYSRDQHPLATSHWERAMMAAKGTDFCKDIEDYLRRK